MSLRSFSPALGLRHPSVQGVLASKRPVHRLWRRRGLDLNALSTSHILDCGDGVRLTGRHTAQTQVPSRGLVVLIHGWEGCHDSSYLYSMASTLFCAGFSVFRLNLRDHASSHQLNEQMFHSARMAEVLAAVAAARRLDAAETLYVIGFSLGGNFALRVALQGPALGIQPRLTLAISPAINPGATLQAIDEGPTLFRKYFLSRWKQTLSAKREAWPHYDFRAFDALNSFVDTTRHFVAEYTEYASYEDYLAQYTLTPEMLMQAPSPIAVISARDDTVIPIRDFQNLAARGSVIACDLTDQGGHCGFIRNWRLESWAEERALELLQHC